mmetsp:Transcript_53170/g.140548  ORF Transcript_53170/g.140548 Transcript_53170/m.140548 type:complete len:406 (-) Transcript_53170:1459-2676(-)
MDSGLEMGSILLNDQPDRYPATCASSSATGRRLCACARRSSLDKTSRDAVHWRVVAAVRPQLAERAEAESKAPAPDKPPELGQQTWKQAFPAARMAEDLRAGAVVFARGRRGQPCLDVCTEIGFGCSPAWFDVVNTCAALLAAFPEARSCDSKVFGVDLPAYRPSTGEVLVNSKPQEFRGLCSSHDANTKRLCACGFPRSGPQTSRTYHTVYSVQASRYFEWQVRFMHHWFKEAQVPGRITRLLSAGGPDFLVGPIPTHVAPPNPVPVDAGYQPYNKPAAIMHWLENSKPTEDVVVIIDPDCMYVSPLEIIVDEGFPVAQRAFFSFANTNDVPMQIARRYCTGCTFVDPIAVPVIIHRRDLIKIAPRWLQKTAQIRAERGTWPPNWDNKTLSPVGLGWTAEMFGC